MPITTDVLLDTNILLRTSFDEQLSLTTASLACAELLRRGYSLATSISNIAEFANSATREVGTGNGLGLSVTQAQHRISIFERHLAIFSESIDSYAGWKNLVSKYQVRGKQVHDTRIVSIMLREGVRSILTFNAADFRRFPEIVTLHPDDILTKA